VKHRRDNTPGTTTHVSLHSSGYLKLSEDLKVGSRGLLRITVLLFIWIATPRSYTQYYGKSFKKQNIRNYAMRYYP